MYIEVIRDWVNVFGIENTLLIRSEDYYADQTSELNRIFRFLGLGEYE